MRFLHFVISLPDRMIRMLQSNLRRRKTPTTGVLLVFFALLVGTIFLVLISKHPSGKYTHISDDPVNWFLGADDAYEGPKITVDGDGNKTIVHQQRTLIKDVEVSPLKSCVGDSVLIKANLTREGQGLKPPVKLFIGGAEGNPRVIHPDRTGTIAINVTADDWQGGFDTMKVTIDVERCSQKPSIDFVSIPSAEKRYTVDYVVRGTVGLEPPITYRWDYGDGSKAQSAEKTTRHSYAQHNQDAPVTTFVVEAVALDSRGVTASRSRTVTMNNDLWFARNSGAHYLPSEFERHVKLERGGELRTHISIYNIEDERASLTQATVRASSCETGRTIEYRIHASSVLEETSISAGGAYKGTLHLPATEVDHVCLVVLELTGTIGASQSPVTVIMDFDADNLAHVRRAPNAGGAARSHMDDKTVAKLKRAHEILGRTYITQEDLMMLEQTGQLKK